MQNIQDDFSSISIKVAGVDTYILGYIHSYFRAYFMYDFPKNFEEPTLVIMPLFSAY